jgi:macrolide transport system ATP-binding/permease protein
LFFLTMLLTVTNITKYFGAQLVLDGVSFVVNAGERIGLVGANGAGKSTLIKIIVSKLEADGGGAAFAPHASVGYLPQAMTAYADRTLEELIHELQAELHAVTGRMRELEALMSSATGEALQAALAEYGEASEHFERLGGYDLDHRIEEVMTGLGVAHLPRDRAVATLSGGEKERVGLAALLLRAPDLLLLDEPTNHLDFAALAWLERYVQAHSGALLAVSHDRQFLNNTVSAILELDEHTRTLRRYEGNYDAYVVARAKELAQWQLDYEAQQEELKELRKILRTTKRTTPSFSKKVGGDKFAKGFFQGRSDVLISRTVRSAEEKLARIEADAIPRPPDEIRIAPEFDPAALEGKTPIRVEGLRKAFGERTLFDSISFDLRATDRIVLTGANGSGKSTLLRIVAGHEQAGAGTVTIARAAKLGYLDQEQTALDPDKIAFDWWREGLSGDEDSLRAEFFRFFLLTHEDAGKRIGALSVGQKRKLQLLKLIAERANVLLLDEPTNHISFDVLEKFERALAEFKGPILAVSHDRWFIERFGGRAWELRDGQVIRDA